MCRGLVLAAVIAVLVSAPADAQTTWYVDLANCPGEGSGAQSDPFCTIQAGIDAGQDGDTVLVAAGTYTGVGNRDLLIEAPITLRCESEAGACVIDCEEAGRGLVLDVRKAGLVVDGFTITHGYKTGGGGGGIRVFADSDAELLNCEIVANSAISNGSVQIAGGGIHNSGTLTLTRCGVRQNTALWGNGFGGAGGGVANFGTLTLVETTVSGNMSAYSGGGIFSNGTLTLVSSAVTGNAGLLSGIESGAIGGGIISLGPFIMSNTTVSGNLAGSGSAGGIYIFNGDVTFTHNTITGNEAEFGGVGIVKDNDATLALTHCIVANSLGGADCEILEGAINDAGYNIIEDGTCLTHPTSFSGDPTLGPLEDNGGPTLTHALLEGSPAVDAIPLGECALDADQRGVYRPQGDGCDIGSFESAAPCETIPDCADLDDDGVRDDSCVWWACEAGRCLGADVTFADMGGRFGECAPDGIVDGHDHFHVMNCFSNISTTGEAGYACEAAPPIAFNVDSAGARAPCHPDGICDGHDVFAALDVFANVSTCQCASGGPAPAHPEPPQRSVSADILLVADRDHLRPNGIVEVDVYLGAGLEALRGYQLHVEATGSLRGRLRLVDIVVDDRKDNVFAGVENWQAFNVSTQQVLVGLDLGGIETRPGAYLATFVFRASRDAAGTFEVRVLHDDRDASHRTCLFPALLTEAIDIESAPPVSIRIVR